MANVEDEPGQAGERGLSVAGARAMVRALELRAVQALSREVTAGQLEDVITDASARRLTIEAERLRTRRRAQALAERSEDPQAMAQIEDLDRRQRLLGQALERLLDLMEELRARFDQVQSEGPAER